MGILLVIATIVSCFIIILNIKENKKQTSKNKVLIAKKQPQKNITKTKDETYYKVDIKGEIINPGIYSLKSNSRVIDVIEKAGGLTDKANTTVLNLSKKIIDEMVIIVYSNQEVKDFEKTKEKEDLLQNKCLQKDENSLKNDACITNDNSIKKTDTKISLNKASLEELMTLPGIGEVKAKEIINYRTEKGEFKSLEELLQISGIGESTLEKIKANLTL